MTDRQDCLGELVKISKKNNWWIKVTTLLTHGMNHCQQLHSVQGLASFPAVFLLHTMGRAEGSSGAPASWHSLFSTLTVPRTTGKLFMGCSGSVKPQHTDLNWSKTCQNSKKGMEGRRSSLCSWQRYPGPAQTGPNDSAARLKKIIRKYPLKNSFFCLIL